VSTRFSAGRPALDVGLPGDPAEQVALVARAKREMLLRAYRRWLRREDLEDCYGQATLELLAGVRRGQRFSDRRHLANALEQRFLSRVRDRLRARRGRSPLQAALEEALPLGGPGALEIPDLRAEVHPLVARRLELGRVCAVASELTPDQRLVLACQVSLGMDRAEFCRRFGWTFEKYRKVAQRGRARLRALADGEAGPRRTRGASLDGHLVNGPSVRVGGEPDVAHGGGATVDAPCVPPAGSGRSREIGTHL
jgi:DNA-directed RNA polymerase specialized sigma24 family protein